MEPDIALDAGSAHVEPQIEKSPPADRRRVDDQGEVGSRDALMEQLLAENQALREQIARGKSPAPSVVSIPPPVPVPRSLARWALNDEGITVQDFLRPGV